MATCPSRRRRLLRRLGWVKSKAEHREIAKGLRSNHELCRDPASARPASPPARFDVMAPAMRAEGQSAAVVGRRPYPASLMSGGDLWLIF
jgi:hypothetical protein